MNQEAKKTTVQLIKYGLVGVLNTLVTLVVIFILNTLLGMDLMIADIFGYIAGVINSFIWNKTWVFKSKGKGVYKEMLLFGIGFLICFGLQYITLYFLREPMINMGISVLGIPAETVGEYTAVIIGMVVYTLCNYLYNRFVTFKK